MSLLIKGLEKLSQLEIDADKDWQTKGITNIKEIAAAMAKGDIVVKGNSILIRFQPGGIGLVLTSAGPLHLPTWMPGAALEFYLPVPIYLDHAEDIVPVDQSHNENAPLTSEHVQAYVDAPGDMIKRFTPAITAPDASAVVPVDQTYNKNAPVASDIAILVDGAVSETNAAVQTDETLAARDAVLNDMTLPPMTPVLGDKYYLGFSLPFRRVYIDISTPGAGNWLNQVYYWNGAPNWNLVAGEDDQTGSFLIPGIRRIDWTVIPGDWALSIIMGMNLYWIKIETTAFVNQTVAPLGATAWACPVA
ncbi:hypothetical protein ES703_86241 [subsurface metagenome]